MMQHLSNRMPIDEKKQYFYHCTIIRACLHPQDLFGANVFRSSQIFSRLIWTENMLE